MDQIIIDQIAPKEVQALAFYALWHKPHIYISNITYIGLWHGRDIHFGNNISHSHAKTRRSWKPNVQNKRLWSDALDRWVPFSVTTSTLKAIDGVGGLDNYLLALDKTLYEESNYITKVRQEVGTALYRKGELPAFLCKRLGYHKNPPPPESVSSNDTK